MNFEVIENSGEWIVRRNGVELARFDDQDQALADVAERLGEADEVEASYSLSMRYQARA